MASRGKTRNRTTVKLPTTGGTVGGDPGTAGRYLLLSTIGKGGQSTVYLGKDNELGRAVAVKVLIEHSHDAEIRIKREARVLAQLKHPGICQIFDIGTTFDRGIFLVLELLEGDTLRDVLEKIGRLSIVRAVSVIHDIAEALRAAHAHQIVHRDLKPENIAVLPDGTLKLFDFGIARATPTSKITRGVRIGTNGYMSPEQFMADSIDTASDIFSLGCIFYELLTGELPFDTGKDLLAGRYAPVDDAIQRELGTKASALLANMLTIDPKARPAASAVADELTATLYRKARATQPEVETTAIVQLLQSIPDEDDPPFSVAEIAERAGVTDEAVTMAILQLPLAFGALRCSVEDDSGALRVRAASEVARYFLKSLALYVQYGLSLIERWDRRDDSVVSESVSMLGPDFVYAMERRRVFQYGLLEPLRIEWPVQVIIKGYSRARRSPVYLMQYDRFAKQYQLIGGRRSEDEPALDAMQRVIAKEMPRNELHYGLDCELNVVRDDIVVTQLSRTLGAFTEYRFSVFSARFDRPLHLDDHDRWVTEEELFSGTLENAAQPGWNYHVARITNALHRGVTALPFSFGDAID